MKASIWYLSFALLTGIGLASTLSTCAFGQNSGATAQTSPGQGSPTVSCGSAPCPQGQSAGVATGKQHVIPPMTPEKAARIDQERRYEGLFADLEGVEGLAKRYEAAGDAAAAASWRRDFARKSGLTPEEAEAVKKIAAQYQRDFDSLNADCHAALLAARAAHVKVTRSDPQSVPASCQKLTDLFPQAMADLLTALGSKSFTRLDGYTRHRLDNARILYQQGQPANSQTPAVQQTSKPTETPR